MVEKGSITVDGISLTIAARTRRRPPVAPPPRFDLTTLDRRRRDPVNLEVDVIAKYVERLLGARGERLVALPDTQGSGR